ncbi:hypothetical protein NQ318_009849 [Aromia moschata]|uniref:HTH CENPB-type domain-containing protein n=1 Tax=Aromia moschata TaxID=1265417 RepID=A0AAV8XA61_9CUCU|nr:hypothetical protein NQ318_009849 [Aromia moschata]
MGKRKHNTLSLSKKCEILQKLQKGQSGAELARIYQVGCSTISDIKKDKFKIERKTYRIFLKNCYHGPGKRKTLKQADFPKMEDALYSWFLKQRSRHVPITYEILAEKAKQFYQQHYGKDDFCASRVIVNFCGSDGKQYSVFKHWLRFGSGDESFLSTFGLPRQRSDYNFMFLAFGIAGTVYVYEHFDCKLKLYRSMEYKNYIRIILNSPASTFL